MNGKNIRNVSLAAWIMSLCFVSLTVAADQPVPEGPRGMQEQGPGRRGGSGDGFLQMLDNRLKLTPEQKEKVKAVIEQGRPRKREIEAEMRKAQEKLKAFMRGEAEKIRDILDAEQKEKFDAIRVHMRERMNKGGDRRHPGVPEGGPHQPSRMQGHNPLEEESKNDPSRFPPEIWQERQGSVDKQE